MKYGGTIEVQAGATKYGVPSLTSNESDCEEAVVSSDTGLKSKPLGGEESLPPESQ